MKKQPARHFKKIMLSALLLTMLAVCFYPPALALSDSVTGSPNAASAESNNSIPAEDKLSASSDIVEELAASAASAASGASSEPLSAPASSEEPSSESLPQSDSETVAPLAPMAALEVTPASTENLSYIISVVENPAYNNGVQYKLTNVAIKPSDVGYASLTVVVPPEYTANYTLPSNWSQFISENIINFIISTPATNGSVANITNFLQNNLSFTLKTRDVLPAESAKLTVNVTQNLVSSRLDPNGKIHYYEYVPSKLIRWGDAYNGAKARTFNGLTGYLATITSLEEQNFIYDSIAKKGGWLGATRLRYKTTNVLINDESTIPNALASFETSTAISSTWYWADGPEAGIVFNSTPTGENTVPGQYAYWTAGEPNNTQGNEFCMQFAFNGSRWNDLPFVPTNYIEGYYVEYGGYDEEFPLQQYAGYEAYFPASVKVQFLSATGTQLFDSIYLFGNAGSSYSADAHPAAPYGYTYTGVDQNSSPAEGVYDDFLKTVTHLYTADQCTVSFDLGYENAPPAPDERMVHFDAEYGSLPAVAREGYRFDGWFTTPDGTGEMVLDNTLVTRAENHTLYARWTANQYRVSFDLNYADAPESPTVLAVTYDTPYGRLPAVSRDGYTFLGWFVDAEGTGAAVQVSDKVHTASNHTLFAKWALTSQNLSFDLNYINAPAPPASQTVYYERSYGTLPMPERTGYTFGGWYLDASATGTPVTEEIKVTSLVNHTLFAKWTTKAFVLDFSLNGATGTVPSSQTVPYDSIANSVSAPFWANYTFTGWNTQPDGKGTNWDFATSHMPANNITLYAVWQANPFTLSFSLNGASGTAPVSQAVAFNSTASSVTPPARAGYIFAGWNTQPDGKGTNWDFANSHMPASNVTLYAIWNALPASSQASSALSSTSSAASKTTSSSSSSSQSSQSAQSSSSSSASVASSSSVSQSSPSSSSAAAPLPSIDQNTDQTRREETLQTIEETGVPIMNMSNVQIPLYGTTRLFIWSLFNLLVTLFSIIAAGLVGFALVKRQQNKDSFHFSKLNWVVLLASVIAIILFLLVGELTGVMVIFDDFSLLFGVLAILEIIGLILGKYRQKRKS